MNNQSILDKTVGEVFEKMTVNDLSYIMDCLVHRREEDGVTPTSVAWSALFLEIKEAKYK